jgi:hypothetical protein
MLAAKISMIIEGVKIRSVFYNMIIRRAITIQGLRIAWTPVIRRNLNPVIVSRKQLTSIIYIKRAVVKDRGHYRQQLKPRILDKAIAVPGNALRGERSINSSIPLTDEIMIRTIALILNKLCHQPLLLRVRNIARHDLLTQIRMQRLGARES